MDKSIVYLVGAGPGNAGMLTLRAQECIAHSDYVLYDQLVSSRILALAPATAELQCVNELADNHPARLPLIHERMIEQARLGKRVVRLKGGDPSVFGRVGEEISALRAAGIPYEVVPGVTVALAAAACLEIPLTHRAHASAIAFVTGHEVPGKSEPVIDWATLAQFPGTLVIYMGIARLTNIIEELTRHGLPGSTPAAIVSHVSCNDQFTVTAPLVELSKVCSESHLTTPALVIVGKVVGLKPERCWFEARPLFGLRVLITRPKHQADSFIHQLEQLGAVAFSMPVIDILPPHDWSEVDAFIQQVRGGFFDWLLFTSANGVNSFFDRWQAIRLDARSLGGVRIAAIGAGTGAALESRRLIPDLVPGQKMNSETLAAELTPMIAGKKIAILQAESGRDFLAKHLASLAHVQVIAVYRQGLILKPDHPNLALVENRKIDVVILTSPNIARGFLAACSQSSLNAIRSGMVKLLSNSQRTSEVIRGANLPVALESSDPSESALLQTLLAFHQNLK